MQVFYFIVCWALHYKLAKISFKTCKKSNVLSDYYLKSAFQVIYLLDKVLQVSLLSLLPCMFCHN